ncbi:hypothetical protein HBI39_132830 [Parastagonospora nodorum]|nr:hypothetical protein HBI39_132830 [Parastagonospora nodorum]
MCISLPISIRLHYKYIYQTHETSPILYWYWLAFCEFAAITLSQRLVARSRECMYELRKFKTKIGGLYLLIPRHLDSAQTDPDHHRLTTSILPTRILHSPLQFCSTVRSR